MAADGWLDAGGVARGRSLATEVRTAVAQAEAARSGVVVAGVRGRRRGLRHGRWAEARAAARDIAPEAVGRAVLGRITGAGAAGEQPWNRHFSGPKKGKGGVNASPHALVSNRAWVGGGQSSRVGVFGCHLAAKSKPPSRRANGLTLGVLVSAVRYLRMPTK